MAGNRISTKIDVQAKNKVIVELEANLKYPLEHMVKKT